MTADLDNLYERMLERLNQLRQERTDHEEILAFYTKVVAAQREAQKGLPTSEIDLPEEQIKLKVDEGFPLIERENFPLARDCTEKLFQQLCQISLEENRVLAAAGKSLLEAVHSGRLDFSQIAKALLQSDTEVVEIAARELSLEYPVLQTLVKLSLQPSLFETAAVLGQKAALDDWRHTYCPVCGALPAMAALVGEGAHQALCSFCGHFWRLPRVVCPFCNNENQEDLRYFYEEGESLYQVHVCEQCRGYIKVMDTRVGGDSRAMAVDDVATAHLDLLAEKEGYQRKAPRLWGI